LTSQKQTYKKKKKGLYFDDNKLISLLNILLDRWRNILSVFAVLEWQDYAVD